MSCTVLFVMNLLLGMILSFYGSVNVVVSSLVIVATGALLYVTDTVKLKDGYKASIFCLFTIGGVLEFILSLVAPNRIENNWWLALVVVLIAFEAILLIVTNTLSNKIN